MSLSPGDRLGPYEIVGSLGAGGMGEVYRARDHRLGRDVAVKGLLLGDASDRDRIARFEREAQVLAALNHPHIAAIYGLEEQHLVLELVEGGTLADRMQRGALPVGEALALARQIASALQAAHDRGIIHRDLKPANIGLTRDNQVKVLDFGLAKMMVAESDAATAVHATEHGVVLGTARYMSPEQARGMPLDKRTDIWSFGCVLFEALTGRHPFGAPTASDTIAAILNREPEWTDLPASTPARVTWLLRRCLEKDLNRRLHDIADARIELDDAIANPARDVTAQAAAPVVPQARRTREALAWTVAAVALAAAAASFLLKGDPQGTPASQSPSAVHSTIVMPRELRLAGTEDPASRLALSPDGRRLIVVGAEGDAEPRLYLRQLDGTGFQPLAGTEGAVHPFWSPNSQSVGFLSRTAAEGVIGPETLMKRIDLTTGQVRTLGPVGLSAPCAWNGDDVILFTPGPGKSIHRMAASGGAASPVTSLDPAAGDVQHTSPYFLPDGRHFLFSAVGSKSGGAAHSRAIYVAALDGRESPRQLLDFGTNAKYADRHILFVRAGRLMAQPFDIERLEIPSGATAVEIAEGVQDTGFNTAGFTVSSAGVIAFQQVVPVPMQLVWFDRSGQQVGTLGGIEDYSDVALSNDGTRVAVSMLDRSTGANDIWVYDVRRGSRERVTSHPASDFAPVWSPSGDRLAFSSVRTGQAELFEASLTGVEQVKPLPIPGMDLGRFAAHWSPDGQSLAFVAGHRALARSDVWIRPMDGDGKAFVFAGTDFVETQPRFSPDGRWMSYTSNENSRLELWVRPASGSGSRRMLSVNGGRLGLWARESGEIFFLAPDNTIMTAPIRTEGKDVSVGEIKPLFKFQFYRYRLDGYPYAVSADGQRILVNTLIEESRALSIELLTSWTHLLNKK